MTAVAGLADQGGEAGLSPLGVGDKAGAPDAPGGRAWSDDAACRGMGTSEFFGTAARGQRWCRRCPVLECCFWWAIVAESDAAYRFGIWGGATPALRDQVAGVTGAGYARARLAAAARQWAAGSTAQRRAG
jgi:hypothetical protein